MIPLTRGPQSRQIRRDRGGERGGEQRFTGTVSVLQGEKHSGGGGW